jgi:hypothetical protein
VPKPVWEVKNMEEESEEGDDEETEDEGDEEEW